MTVIHGAAAAVYLAGVIAAIGFERSSCREGECWTNGQMLKSIAYSVTAYWLLFWLLSILWVGQQFTAWLKKPAP